MSYYQTKVDAFKKLGLEVNELGDEIAICGDRILIGGDAPTQYVMDGPTPEIAKELARLGRTVYDDNKDEDALWHFCIQHELSEIAW